MPVPSEPVTFAPEQVARIHMALLSFLETVEATGGVDPDTMGPVAAPTWTDLGEAYVEACDALGHSPHASRDP